MLVPALVCMLLLRLLLLLGLGWHGGVSPQETLQARVGILHEGR